MDSYDCLHPRDLTSALTDTKQTETEYRTQSLSQQSVHNRKPSIQHGGPMYLRHTKNSFRRMSIAQGIDPQSGLTMPELDDRRWSNFSDISYRDGIEEEDLCYLDNTTLDLQEINSEIQRVEHFMSVKNKHLKLDELQQDLTILKKSVEFDEDSIKQKVIDRRKSIMEKESDRRKSIVDSYLQRRRSMTKSPFL